jgi:hypothetical protein
MPDGGFVGQIKGESKRSQGSSKINPARPASKDLKGKNKRVLRRACRIARDPSSY